MDSVQLALIILVVAISFCSLCGAALLFEASRLKKACDAVQRVAEDSKSESSAAKACASLALTTAQSLQLQHFDTLSAKVAGLSGTVASLQAEGASFAEGLRNVSNKFEARIRREEKELKKSTPDPMVDMEPETYDRWAPPAQNYGKGGHLRTLPSTFGQVAQGG